MGRTARLDAIVAVPTLQPLLHRVVPERPARVDHAAGLDRLSTSFRVVWVARCGVDRTLPALHLWRDHRRSTTVELSPVEEVRGTRWSNAEPPIPANRSLPLLETSELLLRNRPVVG